MYIGRRESNGIKSRYLFKCLKYERMNPTLTNKMVIIHINLTKYYYVRKGRYTCIILPTFGMSYQKDQIMMKRVIIPMKITLQSTIMWEKNVIL